MPKALVAAAATALLGAIACSDATAPVDDYELPEPDTTLAADRLVIGEYLATPCAFLVWPGDGLAHLRDREEWAIVDVFFGRLSTTEPMDRATEFDLDVIHDQGGRILHVFNVPAVRVRMLLSRVPDLVTVDRVREERWITVREVPDATRYDLQVGVGFRRPLRDADIELIESLGGRVTHRFDFINGISGMLPDRSIPDLRANPDVAYVEVPGVGCVS